MKEIGVVLVLVFAIAVVFGTSAMVFVPMLENLSFRVGGGWSNIWLWGTIGFCSFVFFYSVKILDKFWKEN